MIVPGLIPVVAPLLVELGQAVKLRLKIVHRFVVVLFRRGIERDVRRRLGRVGGVGGVGGVGFFRLTVFLLFHRHFCFRHRLLLQHGVLLEFLLHHRLQLKRRRLQQRQRLLQLRRQHLRQRHLLRKMQALTHGRNDNGRRK